MDEYWDYEMDQNWVESDVHPTRRKGGVTLQESEPATMLHLQQHGPGGETIPDMIALRLPEPDPKDKSSYKRGCCGDDFRCNNIVEWELVDCVWGDKLCDWHRAEWQNGDVTLEHDLRAWVLRHYGWEEYFLSKNHGKPVYLLPEEPVFSLSVDYEDGPQQQSIMLQTLDGDALDFASVDELETYWKAR